MRIWLNILMTVFALSLEANEEARYFEENAGLKVTYQEAEKVFKANFPRTDVKVSVNEWPLDPFMGLTSWAAFSPIKSQFIVMGDLVLFEDEVNSVMSVLFENNLDVTALHNHFFFDQPKVYFMHIGGMGSAKALAAGVKNALEKVKQIRSESPSIRSQFPGSFKNFKSHSITAKKLESIFGMQGQTKEGMIKFVFGRKIHMHGSEFGKEMGVNTWAAFGGDDEGAFTDGDFAITEDELQPVLRILRQGNINIVAIHNHMTMENPRMLFLHFWGIGPAEDLARTIKAALLKTNH